MMIASWTAVAGCDVGVSTRPKEAVNALNEYCPRELQAALQEQIPSLSYIGVEDCLCAGIPACPQCVFSQAAAQQQAQASRADGDVQCQALGDPPCCNCCAAFTAPGGGEQQQQQQRQQPIQ